MTEHKCITHSSEPKDIGVSNGVYQIKLRVKPEQVSNDFISLFLAQDVHDFIIKQDTIDALSLGEVEAKLLKKAKLTDLMVFTPHLFGVQYAVSQRFVDCLEKVGVPKEQYKLIPLKIRNVEIPYYLFFVPLVKSSEIDFPLSLIRADELFKSEKKDYLNIQSHEEYLEQLEENPFLVFDSIAISQSYMARHVLHVQPCVDLFFSEELLLHMLENGVTNLYPHTKQIQLVSSFNR